MVLQALERLDERLDDVGGVQAREELEQVAQLLADLAQLVQVLGGAVVVDRAAHLDHLPVDARDPVRGEVVDGLPESGASRRTPPSRRARPASGAAPQRPAGGGQRAGAALLEHAAQRVEVGAHGLRQRGPQAVEVEQVDVEVAQVAGRPLQALELVAEVLEPRSG